MRALYYNYDRQANSYQFEFMALEWYSYIFWFNIYHDLLVTGYRGKFLNSHDYIITNAIQYSCLVVPLQW